MNIVTLIVSIFIKIFLCDRIRNMYNVIISHIYFENSKLIVTNIETVIIYLFFLILCSFCFIKFESLNLEIEIFDNHIDYDWFVG